MNITSQKDGNKLYMTLSGRFDTVAAMSFDKDTQSDMEGAAELELDLAKLTYVSSSGLRVMLGLTKKFGESLTVKNVQPAVMDVFDMTGLSSALGLDD